MKNYHKTILSKSPFGFAYHKIILDERGNPVDYEFIEVNDAFAKLTGLSQKDLPGRTVRQVLPDIEKSAFNWIGFYGKIALEGGEKTFEQYSEPLKRWYKVHVYSPEKYFFATVFTDITTEKEQAERLTKTEKRYRGLIESQNDLIVRVDKENRFTYVNEAYCKAFGKTRDDLIGSDFFPLVHQDDRESTNKAMEQLSHPPYRCYLEQRAMTVNGWRWLAWEDNAIFDDKGEIIEIQGVGRDITEIKEKEDILLKQTASLETLLKETPAVFHSFKIVNGLPDTFFISDNIKRNLGYDPEAFYHNYEFWESCVHPDDLIILKEKLELKNQYETPGHEVAEVYRFKDSQGNYRWISDHHKTIINTLGETEVIGVWIDITEEKQKTEELNQYKQRLTLAQTFAKTGSWEFDIKTGKLFWSKECETLFGLEEGTFEGTFEDFLKRVHPDDRDYVIGVNKPITELKEGIPLSYEHRIINKSGEVTWVKETAGLVNDQNGEPIKIIGLVADITQQKIAAEAIENEKKLQQIVNNIDGVFWLRSADRLDMLYVSPSIEPLFGISQQELYDNPNLFTDAVHQMDKERVKKALAEFLETGAFNEEYRIVKPDGEIRWMVSNAFPVKNETGETVRFAGIVNDITKQKESEIAVKEHAQNLNALIEAMPDMIFIMHRDGTILEIYGPDAEKLIAPSDQLIGKSILDCFDGDETKRHLSIYNDCIETGQTGIIEFELTVGDTKLSFESRVKPLDDDRLLTVVRDVTQTKILQNAHKQELDFRKFLFETNKDGLVIFDADHKVVDVNTEFCQMLGYTSGEMKQLHTWHFDAQHDENKVRDDFNPDGEIFRTFESVHQRKDGTTYDVEVSARSIRWKGERLVVCSCRDISERKALELEIIKSLNLARENQKRFEEIAEYNGEFIWEVDKNGVYTYVNKTATTILGYTRDEMLGRMSCFDLIPYEEKERIKSETEKIFEQKLPLKNLENNMIAKNGEKVFAVTNGIPILDADGNLTGYRGSDRDVTEIKDKEKALKASEQKFKQLVESINDVLFTLDHQGTITYMSPVVKSLSGFDAEKYTGAHFSEFVHPDYLSEIMNEFEQLKSGKSYPSEYPILTKSGEDVWVKSHTKPGVNEDGQIEYLGIAQNITESRKAAIEIKDSEEKYRMLFNANNDSISIFYIDENGKPSNFIEMNEAGAEIIGYTNEELININVAQLEEEVSDSVRLKRIEDIQRNGYAAFETIMQHKSGKKLAMEVKTILINYKGKPAILNISRDITERKKSVEALRASEYKFRHLINNLHAGIVVHNPDTTIRFSNPQAALLLGLTQGQLDGKDAYDPDWKFVDDLGNAINPAEYPVSKVIASKKAIKDKIYGIDRTSTHDRIWVQLNAYPEFAQNGELIQAVITFIDISDIKKAEEALSESLEFNRKLLATIPDLVIRTNLEGNIVFVNEPGLKGSLFHTKEELLGRNLLSFIHEPDLERAVENTKRMFEKPLGVIEYKLQLEDGQLLDYEVNGDVVRDGDNIPVGMVYVVRNITGRKQAEQAIMHGKQRLESFLEISRGITSTLDQGKIMQMVVDNAIRIMGLGSGAIYLQNDEETIRLEATSPALPDDFPDVFLIASLKDHPHIAKTISTGSYLLLADSSSAELSPAEQEVVKLRGLRSNLYLPIRLRENTIGVLILSSVGETYSFTDEEIQLLQGFANQAAQIIDNISNFDKLKKYAAELEQQIEHRKEAEYSLRESEYFANAISNNTPAMLWIYDLEKKQNLWTNAVHKAFFNQKYSDTAELKYDDVSQFIHPDDFSELLKKTDELINNPKIQKISLELRIRQQDGWKWMNAITTTFKVGEQKKTTQILGALFDIDDRKKAEEVIRQNEERFRQVAETNQTVIWEINTEGIYTYVSPMAEKIWGYKPEELVGKVSYFNLHPEEGRKEFKERSMKFVTETGSFNDLVNPIQKRDGSIIWVTTNGVPIFDEYGNLTGYRGSDQDITERLLAENELRKFKTISDQANYGTAITNLDGTIIYVNEHFAQMHGWDSKLLIGENLAVLHNEQQLPGVNELLQELRTKGSFSAKEVDHIRKDGIEFPTLTNASVVYDEHQQPLFMATTAIDITEIKAARLELLKLTQAVVQSPVSVIITDTDGIIEYVNPRFTEISGYSSEEIIGQHTRVFNSGHQSDDLYKELWNTILSGKMWQGELLNKKKNGDLYWEKVTISPIKDNQGQIIRFVAIKEDISEQKRLMEDLIIAKDKAEESNRLKTAFMNNISHEVRTPLNGILGFGSFMLEEGLTPDEKLENYRILKLSSDRLQQTIDDIVVISEVKAGTLSINRNEVMVALVLSNLLDKTKLACSTKNILIDLIIQPHDEDLTLYTDEELFTKIMRHLLDNAAKFTSEGYISFGYDVAEDEVRFFVKDTGIGIHASNLERIFEPYTQEDSSSTRPYEGSGLGLAVAKGMVELLGGSIRVESVKGKGSSFFFTLPLATKERATVHTSEKKPVRPPVQNPVILIAEDDEANYLFSHSVLKKAGYRTLYARNGADAVEMCRKYPEISLILMDIKMPVMSGSEARKKIVEFMPDIPIVACTAFAQTGDKHRFISEGFDDYLAKPNTHADLLNLVKKFTT